MLMLLLRSHSPNDVPREPQRKVSIAAVRGAVRPSNSISQEHFQIQFHIQCKRIQNLQYFFFLLICILMGMELNKLGDFNYIYKSFNVFCASNYFVACKVTIYRFF